MDADWQAAINRILALVGKNPKSFASQPQANRFEAILEAVVPSRKNPTHEKVLAIVNALVQANAVRPDEGGQIYNALLERVSKYNSVNVQSNLDKLVTDVKEAIAQRERVIKNENLSSVIALNGFLSTIPANVERGQENYIAFISALRLMVTEVPQSEVYQAGPQYFFQTSRNGSQVVNLTKAFENLKPLWGVKSPVGERSAISSLLTPNTRLLLLLIAPFTDGVSISRSSYIGHLLTLYRETIGQTNVHEGTYNEIVQVSRALGDDNAENLQATLNFLLTNRKNKIPVEYVLTDEEERVLRYVQQSVSIYLMQDGATASSALDMTSANMEPSFYASNRTFINKLLDYFHRAAVMAPDYFTNAILNPKWVPPEGFFTGEFDFPEVDEGLVWDDFDSAIEGANGQDQATFNRLRQSIKSLADFEPIPEFSPVPSREPSRFPSRASSVESLVNNKINNKTVDDYTNLLDEFERPNNKNMNSVVGDLADKFSSLGREKRLKLERSAESRIKREKWDRWKSYAKRRPEYEEDISVPVRGRIKPNYDRYVYRDRSPNRDRVKSDDEEIDDDIFSYMRGKGNPFAHLMPKGGKRL